MSYTDFAEVYDILMGEVDYSGRSQYLLKLFKKHGKKPTLLLDLACGTGNFSIPLSKQGIEVIGVDMSEDMLAVAREKAMSENENILFLCQNAAELDLYGTVDGAVCCMDSLNHITDKEVLQKAINKVSLFLEEGCLFIFDVNTEYKHREILGDNTFVFDEEEVYCVWQNSFCRESLTTDICLDFFLPDGDGYIRTSEDFSERAYTESELAEILEKANFEIIAIYDDMTENPPTDKSERIIYVTRRCGVRTDNSVQCLHTQFG